jgi:hypothetical protein
MQLVQAVAPLVTRNTANARSSFDADYCINLVSCKLHPAQQHKCDVLTSAPSGLLAWLTSCAGGC